MDHAITFNGNTELQCKNGTYPEMRDTFVASLDKAVKLGHIDHVDANARIKRADALWEKYKKEPNVKEYLELRKVQLEDEKNSLIRAAEGMIEEKTGEKVSLKEGKNEKTPA